LYDGTSLTVDGTGSFNYDLTAAINPFSGFNITWDGLLFNFTSTANDTPSEQHGCDRNDGGATLSAFEYLTNSNCHGGGTTPGGAWSAETGALQDFSFAPDHTSIVDNTPNNDLNGPRFTQEGDFDVFLATPEPHSAFLVSAALLVDQQRVLHEFVKVIRGTPHV
jgi:hypothetical protein